MIYTNDLAGLNDLGELLLGVGMTLGNEKLIVPYLDMSVPRDDSILKQVKMTSVYGKSQRNLDKLHKVMKSSIIKPKDDGLMSRFVCFMWAAFGASCVELLGEIVNYSYKTEVYYNLLYKGLTPWLGEETAAEYALAGAGMFSDMRVSDPNFFCSNRTPEQIAATGDILAPVNTAEASVVYAMALDRADKDRDAALIKRLTDYADNLNAPAPSRMGEGWYALLLLGECMRFSDRVADKFAARINMLKNDLHHIPEYVLRKGCPNYLDVMDKEKLFIQKGYVEFIAERATDGKKSAAIVLPHLEYAAREHTNIYIHCMTKKVSTAAAKKMAEILEKAGIPCPDIYAAVRERALDIVSNTHRDDATDIIEYVKGNKPIEAVLDKMIDAPILRGLDGSFDYYHEIGADDFFCRFFAAEMTINAGYSKTWITERATGLNFADSTKDGVDCLVRAGLPMNVILSCAADYIEDSYSKKEATTSATAAAVAEYSELLKSVSLPGLSATARLIGVMAFGKKPEFFKEELLACAEDSSKAVRTALVNILGSQPAWKDDIAKLLGMKKASSRELAVAVIEKQGPAEYKDALEAAFEKEKSAKIKDKLALLLGAAVSPDGGADSGSMSAADTIAELTKGGKAKKVAWAFEGKEEVVHDTDGNDVQRNYLEALLLCYANMSELGISATAKVLSEKLNVRELGAFAEDVFGKWVDLGAQAKTKWVLYFTAIHGGNAMENNLMQYIKYWGENSRGAIAAEAVRAMALSGTTTALMNVDGMSRKFKNKMVRSAAGEALANAAKELGLTTEELADRIVPDLGFDENMCRVFDYGPRQFKVYLGAGSEIQIYNGDKQIKTMPKPGASDDAEKAAAAAADFKEMKKQLKTVATNQKARLESVLMSDRKWTADGWKELFVRNAVMHGFAIALIWGLYGEDGKLTQTFRYTEEGSFNTADDDELELPENGQIGLVHPLELTKEQIDTWTEQLEDYEITQPFPQLTRKVYTMTDEERKSAEIMRFDGIELNSLSLIGKLTKIGWYKGLAEDAGFFYYFWREDISSRKQNDDGTVTKYGVIADLNFSGASIVNYDFEGEEVTVGKLELYRPIADRYRDKPIEIGEVSDRYFSELIMQLTSVLGKTEE